MRMHGSQWISHKINFWIPGQLKKWKSWEPFWSYQLNNTANPAHLPQKCAGPNWLNWQWCLPGSSKMAPSIFIFSIVLVAEYSSYVKSNATFALTFFGYIISILASVKGLLHLLPTKLPKFFSSLFCQGQALTSRWHTLQCLSFLYNFCEVNISYSWVYSLALRIKLQKKIRKEKYGL